MAENKLTKQSEDFNAWYNEVVKLADLADYGPVKGTMIIKPYGYAIWEYIQNIFDQQIKSKGINNAYFPIFIPENFLKREKEHVEGFSPELAVVTHAGGEKLEEPVVVRPTSETVIYDTFSKWISSYRDLPLHINQWCNVVRWEKRTKPFIRTSEFLWQEGHSVLASEEEVDALTLDRLEEYRKFIEEVLLIPVYTGKKTEIEKFAGAVYSSSCEALLKDGKALQSATSHNLGQNFSKAFDIQFEDDKGKRNFGWQSSWGMSTRIVGALIMMHGDDKGLVLPPQVAPHQAVVIPIYKDQEEKELVLKEVEKIKADGVRLFIDDRENLTPGWKFTEWEVKGVPLRIEIGPRDAKNNSITVVKRTDGEKNVFKTAEVELAKILKDVESEIWESAKKIQKENTYEVDDYNDFTKSLEEKRGYYLVPWCGDSACELKIKEETGATTRLVPFDYNLDKNQKCIKCGQQAKTKVYLAKAY